MVDESELRAMVARNPKILELNPQLATTLGVKTKATKKAEAPSAQAEKKKSNKYRNTKWYEYEDGYLDTAKDLKGHGKVAAKYDSEKELKRWQQLKLLEKSGAITELGRQVNFVLQVGFEYQGEKIRPITYTADFVYKNVMTGKFIVEDVKGYSVQNGKHIKTKEFDIKWKMMKFLHPDYDFKLY